MYKEEIEKLYEELGNNKIDDLYMYSCLLLSGFEKDKAYKLIPLLRELWLKDENNTSIGMLSDMLCEIYDDDMLELTPREILIEMYRNY